MILITGGMGFIGLHTARRILDAGEEVVLTQYRARREPDFIKDDLGKRAHAEVLDVRDGKAMLELIRKYKVTGIVHLAVPALVGVDATEEYQVNMDGLINVLDAARQADGMGRITIASSITVYFSLPQGPFREDDRLPVTSANATEAYKKAWEVLALHYASATGLDVVMARGSFIYGPLYHSMTNPPSRMAHAAVRGGPAEFPNNRYGAPFAEDDVDFCYVKDCATAIQLLEMADSLPHRVYNVGGGRGVTNRDLADATRQAVPDAQIPINEGHSPTYRPDPWLDISLAAADVGYRPEYDVERGMADYIQWLRSNPEVSALKWLLRYAESTPHRSFVLYPLAVLALRILVDRGLPRVDWRFTPLLAWGYLQYRFVGQYRRGQGGGGRGMETLPDQLITSGPYAYLRNPMYLGHLIFLLGLALVSRLGIAWLLLAVNAWWFDQRVRQDERRLDAHFGDPYIRYRRSVPRWLPRPR